MLLRKEKSNMDIIREPELKNMKVLFFLYAFLLFTDFIMPQYFGINIGYDITCTRFANIIFVLYVLCNSKILTHFISTSMRCAIVIPLLLYLVVAGYTMVFRVDVNAFFLVFFEIFTLFMLIYGIRYVIGYKRAIKWSIGCAYGLSIYGLVEFVYGRSLFLQFLRTVPTPVRESYRSGHYRIMGPCGHSLGYGLLLLLFIAIACIDIEKNEIFLFKRPILISLLLMNVFLTGSRSTLGIAVAEMVLIILFSSRANIQKSLFYLVAFVVALGLFLVVFHKTGIGRYVLMQITSVMDQVLGTEYSALFGADVETLNNSEEYRKYLPRIFTLDWLNPFLGRGVKRSFGVEFDGIYIHSIDNYYVHQYIKYAYPGLVIYVIFMLVMAVDMIRNMIRYKSAVCKLMFIATLCYFFNLWWLDALQTLKYEYIIVALFYGYVIHKKDEEKLVERQKKSNDICADKFA